MREKAGIVKYVSIMKKLFVMFSIVALPAIMVCLIFAFSDAIAFQIIAPVAIAVYLFVYGAYALRVSMGTVIGIEVTAQVVHLRTKRKTFTYDVKRGCVAMKVTKRRFVGTFETQDSREKFVFYRRVLFSKWSEEQFTPEEIARFYPALETE